MKEASDSESHYVSLFSFSLRVVCPLAGGHREVRVSASLQLNSRIATAQKWRNIRVLERAHRCEEQKL